VIVSLVVACSENRVIGRDNQLPWSLPADLKHFRRVTMGHPIVMGRRTHESIGKPLPGRQNIVLTSNPDYLAAGCTVVDSWQSGKAHAIGDELMVVGGESLYRLVLPEAAKIYLTEVHAHVAGSVRFPELDTMAWQERSRQFRPADERNQYDLSFVLLERTNVG
jgi:dihydrofolate reductase